ncbi:MAG: nucleotide excision repair endonuclease [Bacillota bacterium]|nr:nucleotide excision repair endonuclease [Bacillota bacterium]
MIEIEIPRFLEVKLDEVNLISNSGGIYLFFGQSGDILYIGKAQKLKTRIKAHLGGLSNTNSYYNEFYLIKYFLVNSPLERDIYETFLINKLQPIYNKSKIYYEAQVLGEGNFEKEKVNVENPKPECAYLFENFKGSRESFKKLTEKYPEEYWQYQVYAVKCLCCDD